MIKTIAHNPKLLKALPGAKGEVRSAPAVSSPEATLSLLVQPSFNHPGHSNDHLASFTTAHQISGW
jgi:hypothetical protein